MYWDDLRCVESNVCPLIFLTEALGTHLPTSIFHSRFPLSPFEVTFGLVMIVSVTVEQNLPRSCCLVFCIGFCCGSIFASSLFCCIICPCTFLWFRFDECYLQESLTIVSILQLNVSRTELMFSACTGGKKSLTQSSSRVLGLNRYMACCILCYVLKYNNAATFRNSLFRFHYNTSRLTFFLLSGRWHYCSNGGKIWTKEMVHNCSISSGAYRKTMPRKVLTMICTFPT